MANELTAVVQFDDHWSGHDQADYDITVCDLPVADQPQYEPPVCAVVAPERAANSEPSPDHFIVRDGQEFAGNHVIIDLWEATGLDDLERMEAAMREAVEVCGATLLHFHLHHFTPNDGISGVAVLAESHISVHTWPERGYAAFDVFMCGDAKPELAAEVFERHFCPTRVQSQEIRRGIVACAEQSEERVA